MTGSVTKRNSPRPDAVSGIIEARNLQTLSRVLAPRSRFILWTRFALAFIATLVIDPTAQAQIARRSEGAMLKTKLECDLESVCYKMYRQVPFGGLGGRANGFR